MFLASTLLGMAPAAHAQTLARPGWTGSGIHDEPWWRSAVFYRIAPEHFQDSDGDGAGDLRGVAQRMDYLRSLGVDAVVLQLPFDDTGFDDLLEEATRRHVRLVIGLERRVDADGQDAVSVARHWLTRGAAGIFVPRPQKDPEAADPAEQMRRDVAQSLLLLALRRLAAQMPGERVVIPEAAARAVTATLPNTGTREANGSAPRPSARALRPGEPQLVLSTLPLEASGVVRPAAVIAALTGAMPGDAAPLLQLQVPEGMGKSVDPAAEPDSAPAPLTAGAEIAAAVLLTQRSAVLLEYGQELGTPAPERMPWTPSNVTPPPEPLASQETRPENRSPAPPAEIVYGPYRPYVPPPPKPKAPPPPAPGEPLVPDPDTLPGFTTKATDTVTRPSVPPGGEPGLVRSAALQDRDPHSLLNLYRRLSALHHGNATLRSGDLQLLHTGEAADGQAVAWLRRAPAGARTAASVVVAVNCGDTPAALSLEADFVRLHVVGGLRSLLQGGQIMGSSQLLLAPHTVFVGELVPER